MLISGFTIAKNANKLYYPVKQSIMSILPIVDEFIVALGDCDEDDNTRNEIESIKSDKIKIIDTVWDIENYPRGMENAHQTDIAKNHCSGDWLFYLQADEVIHEKYLPAIKQRCEELLDNKKVEGLLFFYKHFWGDYNHYHNSHGWYKKEIRIIRNVPEIHSWQSAQSFRRIPRFDGLNYRVNKGTYKLKVALVDAQVYHYGWVRPPELMKIKNKALATIHKGKATLSSDPPAKTQWRAGRVALSNAKVLSNDRDRAKVMEMDNRKEFDFDYGPLNMLLVFDETHPAVMKEWIERFDWQDKLQYSGKPDKNRLPNKHEKLINRITTYIENKILGGKALGEFKNYVLVVI